MGGAVIEGYINENKKMILLPMHHLKITFNLLGDLIKSERLSELLKPAHQLKSPDGIKRTK